MSGKSKHEERTRRLRQAQSAARELNCRIAVHDGVVVAALGEASFDAVADIRNLALAAPQQLGFPRVHPITPTWLQHRAHQLKRWQALLSNRAIRKQYRHHLSAWEAEIDGLSRRLDEVAALRRSTTSRPARSDVLLLAADQEEFLVAIDREAAADQVHELTDAWRGVFRRVVWLAGIAAGRRLFDSVRDHFPCVIHGRRRHLVSRLMAGYERCARVSTRDRMQCLSDWRKLVESVPASLRFEGGLRMPHAWLRSPGTLLEQELRKCRKLLRRIPAPMPVGVLSAVAALCCFDGSSRLVPESVYRQQVDTRVYRTTAAVRRRVACLFIHRSCRQYDTLLDLISTQPWMDEDDYDLTGTMLQLGVERNDVDWLIHESLLGSIPADADVSAMRQCHELIARRSPDAAGDFRAICAGAESAADLRPIARVHEWLRRRPSYVLRPRFVEQIVRHLAPARFAPALRRLSEAGIAAWSRPPRRLRNRMPAADRVPAQHRRLLAELAYYQKLAGEPAALPRSVSKRLDVHERRSAEVRTLRQMRAAGELSPGAQSRLHYLTRGSKVRRGDTGRILEEALAESALRALCALVRVAGSGWWKKTFPDTPAPDVPRRLNAICGWFAGLSDSAQASVQEVLRVGTQHGAEYRRFLFGNQKWLRAAEGHMNVRAWHGDRSESVIAGDRAFVVSVSTDPLETMRMGCLFETCLNLEDGCNRHSVVPNIYDANKAVIYAHDRQGVVRGRKLVAINPAFELLGYEAYVNGDSEDPALAAAIEGFCARWARETGLKLGVSGAPEALSHKWYDDGAEEWSTEAQAIHAATGADCKPGSPVVHGASQIVLR